MRSTTKLMKNWQFTGPDGKTVAVDLPHTWNNIDGQDGGNDYWRGTCTYKTPVSYTHLLTGINDAMVADAPTPEEAIRAFKEFCGDNILVAHNAHSFDMLFIRKAGEKAGVSWDENINEYFNYTHPYGQWKDTGIRLEGDAVQSLTWIRSKWSQDSFLRIPEFSRLSPLTIGVDKFL